MDASLPSCGLYRTRVMVGSIPAGRLVYFHNHGHPGPGIYPPESWRKNRAQFSSKGVPMGDVDPSAVLEPLPPEGFYRVSEAFHCCAKRCREFPAETLVQLGYDAGARPILFVPSLQDGVITSPVRGTAVELDLVEKLARVRIVEAEPGGPPSGVMLH